MNPNFERMLYSRAYHCVTLDTFWTCFRSIHSRIIMLKNIRAHFNNNFGSNITHVANAYSTRENEWIWICFHKDCLALDKIKLAVNSSSEVSIEAELKALTSDEWVRVPYRDFHKKTRNTAWIHLTVISHDGKILLQNYEIEANRSFIITKTGSTRAQKYGGNLWEDEYQRNHYPD